AGGDPRAVLAERLALAGAEGCPAGTLARLVAAPPARLDPLLDRVGAVRLGDTVLLAAVRDRIRAALLDHLRRFQRARPAEAGRARACTAPSRRGRLPRPSRRGWTPPPPRGGWSATAGSSGGPTSTPWPRCPTATGPCSRRSSAGSAPAPSPRPT